MSIYKTGAGVWDKGNYDSIDPNLMYVTFQEHLSKKGLAIDILEEKENVSGSGKFLVPNLLQSIQWGCMSSVSWHLQEALTQMEQICSGIKSAPQGAFGSRVTRTEGFPKNTGTSSTHIGSSLDQTESDAISASMLELVRFLCNFAQDTVKKCLTFCFCLLNTFNS